MSEDLHRRIGLHEGELIALKDRLDRIEPKLDIILETMAKAKGGWAMMLMLSTAAAAVGAFVAKMVGFVKIG